MPTDIQVFQKFMADCDNFPLYGTPEYDTLMSTVWTFIHHEGGKAYTLGYLTNHVVAALKSLPRELSEHISTDESNRTFSLNATTQESRTQAFAAIVSYWQASETFSHLTKWRNEQLPVYGIPSVLYATIERAAAPLFGFVAYIVYLIAYTKDGEEIKVWIQRRSSLKDSWGGVLDATAAGAMGAFQTPMESIVREADEEASIPPAIMARAVPICSARYPSHRVLELCVAKISGTETYHRPSCAFGYELEMNKGEVPVPNDGEVEVFYLVSVEELRKKLLAGKFMPHATKTIIEWLVGRGLVDVGEGGYKRREELVMPLMQ